MQEFCHCSSCGSKFKIVRHVGARFFIAGAGALATHVAQRSPGLAMLGGLGLYFLSRAVDEHFAHTCPACGGRGEPA